MIINGDSIEVLRRLDAESVDLICTDPPYGYSFMGKEWDKAVPSVELWQEVLRVLKPGAFAFVMSAPRSDVQSAMVERMKAAGFRMDFTPIYWTYASGFPKAGNIGKLVDKRNGRDSEQFKALGDYLRVKITDTDQACADKVGFSSALVRWWRLGERIPNKQTYELLRTLYGLDTSFDELIEREEAKRVGEIKKGVGADTGYGRQYATEYETGEAVTDQAKALDGSYAGFQPKPAVEVVLVAMKPLSRKTFVDQALDNGKGVTWLDDCRVPITDSTGVWGTSNATTNPDRKFNASATKHEYKTQQHEGGRFPANLLASDDVFDSYSRYFDLDKWWSERVAELPESVQTTYPFLIVPKAAKSEKGADNKHPTVKPIRLMSYLVTLGSRKGDTVLDPFVGSGTTCIAAKMLGRDHIGIERESEYADIARARLDATEEPAPSLL